jgi:hypothetical protein
MHRLLQLFRRAGSGYETFRHLARVARLGVLFTAASVCHAIPVGERAVLLAIYNGTTIGGPWTISTGWADGAAGTDVAGTECTWYGVTCSAGAANVIGIDLDTNNLSGSLPATLNGLTELQVFRVNFNSFTGPIPPLVGLTALREFHAFTSGLTGTIPPLAGLVALQNFNADNNHLTGTIPPLNALTALQIFTASNNQLTGTIPSLNGLTALQTFGVNGNQLTGPVPALSGLSSLQLFYVHSNQLTGAIPGLAGLTSLQTFNVSMNALTGIIPPLGGLTSLQQFRVRDNQLTGFVPAAPATLIGAREDSGSSLCPNFLTPSIDPAWDAATGITPWSRDCVTVSAAAAMPVPALRLWALLLLALTVAMLGAARLSRLRIYPRGPS